MTGVVNVRNVATASARPVDSNTPVFQTHRSAILPSVILAELDRDRGIPYCRWQAAMLNRLFRQRGVLHEPARITAATVQDGLEKYTRRRT